MMVKNATPGVGIMAASLGRSLSLSASVARPRVLQHTESFTPGERENRFNRWVFAAFGLIGLLLAYLPTYTDQTEFWTLDGETMRWLGVVLFAAGGALRIWPVFVLGRRFIAGWCHPARAYAGHERGLCLIRHPSYLGLLTANPPLHTVGKESSAP
jgi:protein-S-isoprenylcysteine O-methyltransferase Ste14